MTLPRYRALCRHWATHPPLEMLLAAALGVGRKPARADLGELVNLLGGIGTIRG